MIDLRFRSKLFLSLIRNLVLSLLFCLSAQAEQIKIDSLKTHWGATLGGAISMVAAHELGHFIVAEIEDADAYFDGITVKYHHTTQSNQQNLRLSSAGYQAQWLLSEVAFSQLKRSNLSDTKRAFNAGMVLGHIGISAAYASFLKNHENGDATGVSNASGLSKTQIVTILAIPALLDYWRLFGKHPPIWAAWTSRSFKTVGISAVWTF